MEVFRLFGSISINKAKAIADLNAVNAAGASFGTKLGNVFKKIGKVAVTAFAAVTAAAGAIFAKSIKSAAEFELGMAKVKSITGATTKEFEAMSKEAKRLGLETAQTMTDIAAGMEAFGRAGFTATEIVQAMGGAVALAESQVMDLSEAVRITGAVLNGMNLDASESERVANALAAAASSSATTVESLGESMKYLAPVAAALNVPLEEALTIVGKLGDAGLTGGRATRALATALEGLASPTDEAADALEKLGIETFTAQGDFIGITELVGQLESAFNDLGYTSEQRMEAMSAIFAGSAGEMNILISAGVDELERYQESITGTTKAFDQQAAMLDTLSGQWTILKGSVELALVTIGTGMMPILKDLLKNHIIPLVNGFTNWLEEMGGITGVVGHALIAIGNYLIAAADWIESHEMIRIAVEAVWSVLKDLWSFVVNVFKGDWSAAWESIKSAAVNAGRLIVDIIREMWNILPISDETKAKIIGAFNNIMDAAKRLVSTILGAFTDIEVDGTSILDRVVSVLATVLNAIAKLINFLIDHKEATKAALAVIASGFIAIKVIAIANWFTSVVAGATAATGAMGALAALLSPAGLLIAGLSLLAFGIKAVNSKMAAYNEEVKETVKQTEDLVGTFSELTNSEEDLETANDVLTMAINRVGSELNALVENGGMSIITLSEISAKMDELNRIVAKLPVEEMEGAWRAGVEAILAEYEEVVPGISDILDDVVGVASDKGEEIGTSTAEGVEIGMNKMGPRLEDAGADSMNLVLQAMRDAGLIESPSKAAEEIGDQTSQGFIDGLRSKGQELIETGQRMVDQALQSPEEDGPDRAAAAGEATADAYTGTVAESIYAADERLEQAFDSVTDTAADGADDVEEEVKTMWDEILDITDTGVYDWKQKIAGGLVSIKDSIKTSLGDMVSDLISYGSTAREEQSAHEEAMQAIRDDYAERMKDATGQDYADLSAQLTQALAEEQAKYDTNKTTIVGIVKDMVADIGNALLDKAIETGVDWVVEQLWRIATESKGVASAAGSILSGIGSLFSGGGAAAGGAAATGGAAAGTGAAAGAGVGVGTIVQGAVSAAVPLLLGTQTHEQIKKTDEAAKNFLSPVLNVIENVNDWIHKIFPSKKDKEEAGFATGFYSPSKSFLHGYVGESGPEALLPLRPEVFDKIGAGVAVALEGAGVGGNISIDMRGMYDGATLNVRNESDIELIAQEHYSLFKSRLRSEGVRT